MAGCLLTMCADTGVDYIDKNLEKRLKRPGDAIFQDEEGSLIGHMLSRFSRTGSSTWVCFLDNCSLPRLINYQYKRDVNWFLLYLLTEVVAKPHNIRQGCNAPSLGKAYQNVVQNLVRIEVSLFGLEMLMNGIEEEKIFAIRAWPIC